MLSMSLSFLHGILLLATLLLSVFQKSIFKRWTGLIYLAVLILITWFSSTVQLETTLSEEQRMGVVVEGDGVKSLFVWYLGWMPALLLAVTGKLILILLRFINRFRSTEQ